jgi:hypothetical protein
VELEMRAADDGAGAGWREVDGVMGEDEATLTIKRLDPSKAYEFRAVAHNRRGSTPGNSTGQVSVAVAAVGALLAPHATATSSQTVSIDWSHLATGCAVPPWTVSFRRAGEAGDGWVELERGYRRTSVGVLLACPSGCVFRVIPELPGWDQPYSESPTVSTPILARPPAGAVRLLLRFRPAAAEIGASAPGGLVSAFEAEVGEALHLPPGRVRVTEIRRAQSALYAALDVLPPSRGGDPSVSAVVSGLRAQLLDDSSLLRSTEVGSHLNPAADVTSVRYDANGEEVSSTLQGDSEAGDGSLSLPVDGSAAQPGGQGGGMLWALGALGFVAAAGCGLYNRAIRGGGRQAGGRGLYTGLRSEKELPQTPGGDAPESLQF